VIGNSVYYLKTKLRETDEKVQQHLNRIKSKVDNSTASHSKGKHMPVQENCPVFDYRAPLVVKQGLLQ